MTKTPESQRNRRLIAASIAMLLIAGGVFGRMIYLGRQIQQVGMPHIIVSTMPDLTPQEKAQSINRARELREKWRPWALQHQAQIKQMLNAKAGDRTPLATVWNAVPVSVSGTGLTPTDLAPPGTEPPSPTAFSWVGLDKVSLNGPNPLKISSDTLKVMTQGQNAGLEQLKYNFNAHRDMIIATSLTPKTETHLWISGRVTQTGRVPADQKKAMIARAKSEGRPFSIEDMRTPHQQVEPPYDFLPSTTFKSGSN